MPKHDVTVSGSFTLTSEQLALDGIQYTLWVKEKTAEIVGFDVTDGFTGQVSIPSTVTKDGTSFDVTRIGDSAFSKCENLTSVTIPESISFIGESAFAN
ncbi:MAG: leucine-rich repeat protein [Prevotella sp.]|nr:leucine-rich repeat protein [Prevotella sp.]